jgi:hypothetical protein
MSELDFDELDKAVNTLMGDVPKSEPAKTDDIKTLNIASSLPADSRPSFEKLDSVLSEVNSVKPPVVEKPVTTPTVALPSLATRRSGRFMDVVHPSSDMSGTTSRPLRPMSRQGVNLQPSTLPAPQQAEAEPEAAVVTDDNSSASLRQDDSPSDSGVTNHDAPQNDWPDPLEMSDYQSEPEANVDAPALADDLSEDQPGDDELFTIDESDTDEAQPLTSPFLADAKVEKRPLGGVPTDEAIDELDHAPVLGVLAAETDLNASDPTDQLPASAHEVEPQLPPELRSDLMANETDGGTSPLATSAVESTTADAVKTPETVPAPAPVTPVETPVQSMPKPSSIESVIPAGPTSIPQQYQEEPSTSDEPSGSIYDTDSYHQPLAHPAKTKSGWLWVIWILLLLIVGGGGAVALYFLGII